MPPEKHKEFLKSLRKIPIFKGLSPTQAQQILAICKLREFAVNEVLCKRNSTSNEMYILITGELGVLSEDGVCLANLHPITTVGEIGLLTRQERSAQVEALKPSKAMVIEHGPFHNLLRHDDGFKLKIYQSVVEVLAEKIVNDNVRVRDHLLQRVRSEELIFEYRKKLDFALDLIAERPQIARDEACTRIDERFMDTTLCVLVVDDEDAIREFVKHALSDYKIQEARNGEEALTIMQAAKPDLVITDIRMPRMDGFELAARIQQDFPEIPVIALSGYISRDEAAEHNFVDFIDKPARLEDLSTAIEDALRKQ